MLSPLMVVLFYRCFGSSHVVFVSERRHLTVSVLVNCNRYPLPSFNNVVLFSRPQSPVTKFCKLERTRVTEEDLLSLSLSWTKCLSNSPFYISNTYIRKSCHESCIILRYLLSITIIISSKKFNVL